MIVSGESINGYSGGCTLLFSEISVKWSSQGGLRLFFLNLRGNTCIVCVVVLVSELSENRPIYHPCTQVLSRPASIRMKILVDKGTQLSFYNTFIITLL